MIITIDYGTRKCGYAIGSQFIRKSGVVKTEKINDIIKSGKTIVLGLPLSMSGNYSSQTFKVLKFGEKLVKKGFEVYLYDERLTSRMAKSYGIKDDDAFSARQIFLDYIQNPEVAQKLLIVKPLNIKLFESNILYVETPPAINVKKCIALTKNHSIALAHYKKQNLVIKSLKSIDKKFDIIVLRKDFLIKDFYNHISENGIIIKV
ncbi:Holliday junction resolvase RuvX [Thermosipho ferrireducens]|uniref:Holliday junction resolvase RuvX n=1 Tax=Thermosipho ferrireducens TaxID=2571116 RepID=A0ABX7S439_9BACT|nr:RuvX/YqgF family protein [Thermosipho ferrireducens]QTA37179.1 Holliday junction resolvase RuvX [Thermosipho ferrireducens]